MKILSVLLGISILFTLSACKKTDSTAKQTEKKIVTIASENTEAPAEETEEKDLIVHIESETQYDTILKENKYVVADFYADWCPPCKKLAPHVEKLSDEFEDEVVFLKINVEKIGSLAKRYDVDSIPRIFFFKDGKDIDVVKGYMDLGQFREKVNGMMK